MNKTECIHLLESYGIETTFGDILFPKNGEFPDEIHDAIDFLIDKRGYGVQYINQQ